MFTLTKNVSLSVIFTPHSSQYPVDMLIGQDLLNAHFNMTPLQPTYHITPSLAIIRTKMGLAFIGKFDKKKFRQWRLNATETQKLKATLYPDNEKSDDIKKISLVQKEEIDNILTLNVSDIKRNWSQFFCKCFLFYLFSNFFNFSFN